MGTQDEHHLVNSTIAMNSSTEVYWATNKVDVESHIDSLRQILQSMANDIENIGVEKCPLNTKTPPISNAQGLTTLHELLQLSDSMKKLLKEERNNPGDPDEVEHHYVSNC